MSTSEKDVEIRVLQKIEDLLEGSEESLPFTKDEQRIIRQMIQVYQTLISFGRLGVFAKNLIIGASAFLAAWWVIYAWFVGNLKSMVGLE